MCDCLEKAKDKILEHVRKQNDKTGKIDNGDFKNKGLSLNGGGWKTYQPFEYEMQNIKKDGSMGAIRKHTVDMYHTFCPFCGKKHKD